MKYHTQWDDSALQFNGFAYSDPPVGWTKRFDAGSSPANYPRYIINYCGSSSVLPLIKRRMLSTGQSAAGRGVVSWDKIDNDPNRADVELHALYYVSSFARETGAYLVARGSTGATTAYYGGFSPSTDTIRITKVVAGVVTDLATGAFSLPLSSSANPASSAFWCRFRISGTNLSLRVWAAGTDEPSTWTLTASDAAISAAGFVGFWNEGNAAAGGWNFFACATQTGTVERPITETEYAAWLRRQDAQRCVIAEIRAIGFSSATADYTKSVPYYLSNAGYISHEQDTPSSRSYPASIAEIPTVRSEIGTALRGRVSVGFSELVVSNPQVTSGTGGVRDKWLRQKWRKSTATLMLGDSSWPRHDFRPFFVGRLKPPTAPAQDRIVFPLSEIAEAFADPLQNNVFIAGAGLNFADEYKPLTIGNPKYVEPPLYDSTNLLYKLHDGVLFDPLPTWVHTDGPLVLDAGSSLSSLQSHSVTAVSSVNDNFTVSPAHGAGVNSVVVFTAGTPPTPLVVNTKYYVETVVSSSQVKVSATRGGAAIDITGAQTGATCYFHNFDTEYTNGDVRPRIKPTGRLVVTTVLQSGTNAQRVADMIDWIVFQKYGLSTNFRDLGSITALELAMSASGYDSGVWIGRDRTSVEDALNRIVAGSNVWYGQAPDGTFQLGRIDLPSAIAVATFGENDVAEGNLQEPSAILPIDFTETRVKDRPVWLTGGPYFSDGVEVAAQLAPKYAYAAVGTPIDTPLQGDTQPKTEFETIFADATVEQARLATLYGKSIGVFSFRTHLGALPLKVGDTIALVHPRKGWKVYTASDSPSVDNPAAFDATKAVIIKKDVNLSSGDPFKVALTVVRQIPQYSPEAAEDMPGFDSAYDARGGTILAVGGAPFTYTRASVAWEFDHEGILRQIKSGEAPFRGWRREENLAQVTSVDLGNAAWTKTSATVGGDGKTVTATGANGQVTQTLTIPAAIGGGDYIARFRVARVSGTGNIQAYIGGSTLNLAVGSTPLDFFSPLLTNVTGTLTWGVRIVTSGDVVTVEQPALYDVSGRANQAVPEYVSIGALSAPYHGLGADGVKAFGYTNGNVLAAPITDARGPLLSFAVQKHLHVEPYATTNRITAPRDLTNAAWTKTNTTAARNVVGMDGRANSASRLTATLANGSCTQLLAALGGAADCRFGVYLKRISGTGGVDIEITAGVWVAAPALSSSAWTLVATGAAAVTARTVGFRLQTNGDVIAVDFGLEETRSSGNSSPVDTAVVATRAAASMSIAAPALDKTKGTAFAEFAPDQSGAAAATMYPIATDTTGGEWRIDVGANIVGYLGANRGQYAGATQTAKQMEKVVHRWDANRDDIFYNGAQGAAGAGSSLTGASSTIYVGQNAAGGGVGIYISRIGVMATVLNDDQASDLSS